MKFTPKSDEELLNLLPEGEYHFSITSAQDTTSKAGSEMIKLTLNVEGKVIFDYLLEAMPHKIKHFAEAVGLEELYQSGGYDAQDCIGKLGYCKVSKQEASNGFQAKNTILDYVKRNENANTTEKTSMADLQDDNSIPF